MPRDGNNRTRVNYYLAMGARNYLKRGRCAEQLQSRSAVWHLTRSGLQSSGLGRDRGRSTIQVTQKNVSARA